MRRPSDRLHAYEKLSLALRAQGFFVFLLPLSKLASGYKQKSPIALQPGFSLLVRMKGLEPSRDKALVPKTSVSTNFTTSASIGTANIDRKITLREKMIGWLEKLTLLKIFTHGKF